MRRRKQPTRNLSTYIEQNLSLDTSKPPTQASHGRNTLAGMSRLESRLIGKRTECETDEPQPGCMIEFRGASEHILGLIGERVESGKRGWRHWRETRPISSDVCDMCD